MIVVLHKGKVMETGTHDELMALGGRYASLYSHGGNVVSPTESVAGDK